MKLFFLIIAVVVVNSQIVFALEQKDWSIVSNKNSVMFAASANIEASRHGRELQLSDKMDMSSPEALLANYYWLLKSQQLNKLADFYTVKDGSRAKFEDALKTNKLKLTKFNLLESVRITSTQQWGAFTAYSLKLFAGKKGKMNWQERVVCEKRCYLVFSILEKNPASDLLELSLTTFLNSNIINGDLTHKVNFQHKPIAISVIHPEGRLYKAQSTALTYQLDLGRYPKVKKIEKGIQCEQYNNLETNAFCIFLQGAKKVNSQDKLALNKYMFDLTGGDTVKGRMINVYVNNQVKSRFYSAHAFITLVNSWQSIELIGYIEGDTTRFVLFKPTTIYGEILPIQAVTFIIKGEGKSNQLIYGDNWEDAYLFFYNDIFMNGFEQAL
jgi:hypothetical protein